jgi:hypothetical protein
MKSLIVICVLVFLNSFSQAQNLHDEKIRKITSRKRSIYFDKGIFHNGGLKRKSQLKAVRHSFVEKRGYERLVFDFKTSKVPRVYGNVSMKNKKLYFDFFNTKLPSEISSFGDSKHIKGINFFPLSEESLSLELDFKSQVSVDIFYLENPGRLVVDIKG